MKNILIIGSLLFLVSCNPQDELDFACDNLSNADAIAQAVLKKKNANTTAYRVEADAVATVVIACQSRPLDNKSKIYKAALTAMAAIITIELSN